MKFLEKKYPLGTYPNQQTPGLAIDGNLASNIKLYARNILKDNQFLGLCSSSTFNVRVGKSTLMQHVGEYYTYELNKLLKAKFKQPISFTHKNIVFSGEKLIKRAFELDKYSCIILDESDDVTGHHLNKRLQDLKRFFRKSGQLNLFIILILPNFFEFPKTLAIQRSNFLIDVKFTGEFERGRFEFYGPRSKKKLYIHGKKNEDYSVCKSDFYGKFPNCYSVDDKIYKQMKDIDIKEQDDKDAPTETKIQRDARVKAELFTKICDNLVSKYDFTVEQVAECTGIARRTAFKWMKNTRNECLGHGADYNTLTSNDDKFCDDEVAL
jgi:hypothetical protein